MSEQPFNTLQDANRRLRLEVEELRRRLGMTEGELDAEREQAASALEQADRQREEFLSRLAHDLRNPLAPMQNAVELLRLPDTNAALRQRAIDIIDGQVRNLLYVLDALQDFSRIVRGRIDLRKEPVDVAKVVARAVENSRPLLERRKHRIDVALPPADSLWVHADAVRLTQIVAQLLDNAVKFTDEGGRIHLAAALAEDEIEVRVEDNGIGIDPEMLPGIFDLFAKTDNPRGPIRSGLGIGLSMVRKLVKLHGGRVEASSAGPGRGSVFVVRVPRLADEKRLAMAPRESIDTLLRQPSRRMLIVSANQEFAEEWCLLLRVAGHEVRTADSAMAALDAARTFQPQVISLDMGVGGDEFARRLREQTGLEKVMMIAVAEDANEASRLRAAQAGCDALLGKPVRVQDFLRLIAKETSGLGRDTHA